eukprot:m.158627 g.158627  ORF g.158627 m.158627 type:complete len:173 (+) comp16335_c8_seq3:169-687(+)
MLARVSLQLALTTLLFLFPSPLVRLLLFLSSLLFSSVSYSSFPLLLSFLLPSFLSFFLPFFPFFSFPFLFISFSFLFLSFPYLSFSFLFSGGVQKATVQQRAKPTLALEQHLKVLRSFDLDPDFGPCIGISRMERWVRAQAFGLDPPENVRRILEEHPNDNEYQQSIWTGQV